MSAPYEKLKVWHLAHKLTLLIYNVTASFPASERYGLINQMRRAAIAVETNIVEGNARNHRREYIQFCHITRASAVELGCLLRLSLDLGLLRIGDYEPLHKGYDELSAILFTMIRKLEAIQA